MLMLIAFIGGICVYEGHEHLMNGYLPQFTCATALSGGLSCLAGVAGYYSRFPDPLILGSDSFQVKVGYSSVFSILAGIFTLIAGMLLFYEVWVNHNKQFKTLDMALATRHAKEKEMKKLKQIAKDKLVDKMILQQVQVQKEKDTTEQVSNNSEIAMTSIQAGKASALSVEKDSAEVIAEQKDQDVESHV